LFSEEKEILVAIPTDIVEVMDTEIRVAVRWREATRNTLVHYLTKGYEVQEIFPGERTSDYLLVNPGMP
jgi:predicted GNAT superfamily acetyltransferase